MEISVLLALIAASFVTALGCFAHETRRAIIFLSLQAVAIGSVELMYCLINLSVGLNVEVLIDFFAAFAEWFSAAVVVPLIIYWGMIKTENVVDESVINNRKIIASLMAIVCLHVILWAYPLFALPIKLGVLPFCMLMFSLSVFLMITRRDPLKIIVGLNMAENALYPLFAESPLMLVPFILGLMIFVTVVGVYVVTEAYRDYGTMSISEWRLID